MEPNTQAHASMHMKAFAVFAVLLCAASIAWRIFASYEIGRAPLVAQNASSTAQNADGQDDVDYFAELEKMVNGDPSATTEATSSNPVEEVGVRAMGAMLYNTEALKQNGTYTPEKEKKIAEQVIEKLKPQVPYQLFTVKDAKTVPQTSYDAMMKYRASLQTALKPLLENKKAEIEIFGLYAETKDKKYLAQLRDIAANYALAATNTVKVAVPQDGVIYHTNIVNAMREFDATLRAMVDHADDPVTTGMLTTSYNQAEGDMVNSFNALASYFKSKVPTQ